MGKPLYQEGANPKDKKSFAKYLAEDEELVLATGYGKNYLRHNFVFYIIWPGVILIVLGLVLAYFNATSARLDPDSYRRQLGIGLLLGLAAATLFAFIKTVWLYNAHRYLLTTRRVIIKEGFFSVKLTSALYDKITHIEADQSFIDRAIMHHGTIIINTAGVHKDELKLSFVDNPIELKNLMERLINREREQFGRSVREQDPVKSDQAVIEGELVE